MTNTFTFPSGTSVELPGEMPLCSGPTVTERGISCPAYNQARSIFSQRQEVAERERILTAAVAGGRPVGRLSDWLTYHRNTLDVMLKRCTANPVICTCGV